MHKLLYRLLPFEQYLWVVSQIYFISFKLGLLKNNPIYRYPHFLEEIIRPGDTVLDIGANLGYFTKRLAELCGPSGRVYAVEPVKPILNVLRKNVGHFSNVTIYPYALGEENTTVQLGNNSKIKNGYVSTGTNQIITENNQQAKAVDLVFEAEMKKGSELFADLPQLDFIKCDIEGYEGVVLKEMKAVIEQHLPMILVETVRAKRREILQFMTPLDYLPLVLDNGQLRLTKEDEMIDILFVHPSKVGLLGDFYS